MSSAQGRQFLLRSGGDEIQVWPSFADFSLAFSYIILKGKVWTPRGGMAIWHAPGQFNSKVISVDSTLLLVYINNSAHVCCHGIYIL